MRQSEKNLKFSLCETRLTSIHPQAGQHSALS
jgi:hypothetical protein